MEISNNESNTSSIAIPKHSLIMEDGIFTLTRKTRAGSPNANGHIYTKEAFDKAMEKYIEKGGKLYLAPVAIDKGYDIRTLKKINSEIYVKFNDPPNDEYIIGEVISWTDYTMTFKYTPTDITSALINTILEESTVCVRYSATIVPGIPISDMNIICLDIASIPLEVLGIDINSIIKNK